MRCLYLEAYGWLANCGVFNGILDGFLAFDSGGNRISFQLQEGFIPANSLAFATGQRQSNPRWYTDQYPWNWNVVFSH